MRTSLLRVVTTIDLGVSDIGLGRLLEAFLDAASNIKTIMRKQGMEYWVSEYIIDTERYFVLFIAVQLHLQRLTFSRLKS
jgi:hypothetical protein